MPDIKPENVKEYLETQSDDESKKLQDLGWVLIDTFEVNSKKGYTLAWVKDGNPVKP